MSQAAAPSSDDTLTARPFARQARLSPELVTPFITPSRSAAGPVYTREPLPMARAGVVGRTGETGAEHVIRAAVDATAHHNRGNVDALVASGMPIPELKVDGGGAASYVQCPFRADICGIPVLRPRQLECTALGVVLPNPPPARARSRVASSAACAVSM